MATNHSQPAFSVHNLRLSRSSPPYLGVDTPRPSISWATISSTGNWIQNAYQVSVTLIPTNVSSSSVAFTSSRIATRASLNQPWPKDFQEIKPYGRYTVAVRVWGGSESGKQNDEPSSWAKLTVEGGLMAQSNWFGAQFITTEDGLETWDTPQPVPLYRKTVVLQKVEIARAMIYATALGVYRLYIDGVPVGDSIMEPGWTTYQNRLLYQSYDVTKLVKGKAKVEVRAYVADGWYRGRLVSRELAHRGFFGKQTGLMMCLHVNYEDGSGGCTVTDTSWSVTTETKIRSTEIYDGEVVDARICPQERGGKWEAVDILPFNWDGVRIEASTAPAVRHTETFKPIKKLKSPSGKTILDFGQNLVGRLHITATAKAGTEVSFVHVEVLEKDGSIATRPLRDAKATDKYTFSGSTDGEEWEPEFTFHGFRYVQVTPWIEGMQVFAKVYGSDCDKGLIKFESSHNGLNHLVENIRWSTKGNFFSIPTDCPQRDERLGWTGDIQVFAPTATFIFDCQSFLSNYMRDLIFSTSMNEKSIPPLVCPDVLFRSPNAVWQDVVFTLPWNLYKVYGDTSILEDSYITMKVYFERGIPKTEKGTWADTAQYGDWLDPDAPPDNPGGGKTNSQLVANAYLAHCAGVIAKTAGAIGYEYDEAHYTAEAEYLKSQFVSMYTLPGSNFRLSSDTQTAYSLAINFSLLPPSLHTLAVKRLRELIVESNYHLNTGFAGTPELLHAIGDPELAYKVLLEPQDAPSWLYPVNMGATTIWERWDSMLPDGSVNPGEMTSFNHYAYGAVGRWVFENVGGICMDTEKGEGWRNIIFQPTPSLEHALTECEIEFEGPLGRVGCKWKLDVEKEKLWIEVDVPGNCEAVVVFPRGCLTRGCGNDMEMVAASSLRLKSGKRDFSCHYAIEDQVKERIDWEVVQKDEGRQRRSEEVDYVETRAT